MLTVESLRTLKPGEWNKRRRAGQRVQKLAGSDLSGLIARRIDLRELNLRRSNLSGADLSRAALDGARFTDANLTRVRVSNATLRGAHLARARLRDAQCDGSDMQGGDLTGADLSGASLVRSNLSRSLLCRARLAGADLSGACLVGADLTGAVLSMARLVEADLTEACLWAADLRGADLMGANLHDSVITCTGIRDSVGVAEKERLLRAANRRDAGYVLYKVLRMAPGGRWINLSGSPVDPAPGTTLRAKVFSPARVSGVGTGLHVYSREVAEAVAAGALERGDPCGIFEVLAPEVMPLMSLPGIFRCESFTFMRLVKTVSRLNNGSDQ